MSRPMGPAFWIITCFCFYLLTLSLLFYTPAEPLQLTKEVYTVARDASWSPFNFAGKTQQVTAFSDELLVAIAESEGIVIHIQPSSASSLFIGLKDDDYDGITSSHPPDGALLETHYVSDSYYGFGPVIIAPIGSTIHSIEQLRGKVVGITQSVEFLMQYTTDPDTMYVSYPELSNALEALASGSLEAVIGGRLLAENYVASFYRGKLEIVTPPLSDLGLRFFTMRNDKGMKLISHFSHGLRLLRDNGIYDMLLQKWNLAIGPQEDPTTSVKIPSAKK